MFFCQAGLGPVEMILQQVVTGLVGELCAYEGACIRHPYLWLSLHLFSTQALISGDPCARVRPPPQLLAKLLRVVSLTCFDDGELSCSLPSNLEDTGTAPYGGR